MPNSDNNCDTKFMANPVITGSLLLGCKIHYSYEFGAKLFWVEGFQVVFDAACWEKKKGKNMSCSLVLNWFYLKVQCVEFSDV